MDSFKFNTTNYPNQTYSLVDAQNKLIEEMKKDNKVLSQDRANYAVFRTKETQRQLNQLQNIISGLPKLKKNLEGWKEKREAGKEVEERQKEYDEKVKAQQAQDRIDRTGVHSTGMKGLDYDDPGYQPLTKEEEKKRLKQLDLDTQITTEIQNNSNDEGTLSILKNGVAESSAIRQKYGNTGREVTRSADKDYIRFAGEGQAMLAMESGDFRGADAALDKYLTSRFGTESFRNLSKKNKILYFERFRKNHDNYRQQASRTFIANTNARYKAARATDFLDDIDTNPSLAVSNYLTKHQNFDGVKNTPQALFQLQSDIEYLEKEGLFTHKTYEKLLNSNTQFNGQEVKLSSIKNPLTTWLKGRKQTLISQTAQREKNTVENELRNAIEQSEKEFEQLEDKRPEELSEWRATRLTELIDEHTKSVFITPYHPLFEQFKTGMTRLDGPEHSTTVDRLVDMSKRNAPIDDELYKQLPTYYKNQYHKAIGGNDGADGDSGESIGIGKLKFKSYFNALKEGGGWHTWVMGQMRYTDIETAKSNPRYGWIIFQGQEDYVTKFEELRKIGSVRDAQAGALKFIKEKYKDYYNNPIEEGFDEKIISSITEGRKDIIPRLKGKSQDDKLAVLNQSTFWEGEEVAFEELIKWSRGYGEFPQYYRQIDDNMFKDITPREIAVHRMEIHKERIEKKEDFNNALKAIYKGVELDKKLYDSLPLDTSRLFTNHNTAGRTYRAEVIEKDNPEVYEHLKINDDPNAYTLTNPYILEKPGNLSEMSLIEVLRESEDKRINTLGLYGLTPDNIMDVLSEEENINGFLNTKFDEELQTELKRRLARLAANKGNQTGALVENPNPLPNLIPEDAITLTEAFGPQDWYTIPPSILLEYAKELQKNKLINY